MDKRSNYDSLRILTENTAIMWKKSRGFAPDSAADKMDAAMLSWMLDLTDTLKIWIDKGVSMTDGELILARTNMGALVESWLNFFYCVFYEDYIMNPIIVKGRMVEPNKMTFDKLKNFSKGILWDDNKSAMYIWVDKIQHYRNAIHIFNYKDIGTAVEFMSDMDEFYKYVKHILNHIPPIEDFVSDYLEGDVNFLL